MNLVDIRTRSLGHSKVDNFFSGRCSGWPRQHVPEPGINLGQCFPLDLWFWIRRSDGTTWRRHTLPLWLRVFSADFVTCNLVEKNESYNQGRCLEHVEEAARVSWGKETKENYGIWLEHDAESRWSSPRRRQVLPQRIRCPQTRRRATGGHSD